MGFIQCWILVELSLRISLNIRYTRLLIAANHPNNDKDSQLTDRKIKLGRRIVITVITLNVIFCLSYLLVDQIVKAEADNIIERTRWDLGVVIGLCIVFVLHLICVIWLVNRLKTSRD